MSAFFCTYCLETTEAEDYPPDCSHCHVGFCPDCNARDKTNRKPHCCTGCGKVPANPRAIMYREESTSGAYAAHNWGLASPQYLSLFELIPGDPTAYGITTVFAGLAGREPGRYLGTYSWHGSHDIGRRLTPAEEESLK